MKAVYFSGDCRAEIREAPEPAPGPDEDAAQAYRMFDNRETGKAVILPD